MQKNKSRNMNKYENKQNKQKTPMIFINEKIHCKNSRIVDDGNGNQLDVMPTQIAIQIAKAKGLDLIQIGFNNGISICKIYDYGKFTYEQKQKAKEAKKKAKATIQDVKELSFTIRIDTNDLNIKIRHAREFLNKNCKVKLVVRFSRREMCHLDLGKNILKTVLNELKEIAELDSMPKAEGRQLFCIVKPKK